MIAVKFCFTATFFPQKCGHVIDFFVRLCHKLWLLFDGKTTAQSYVFCSVTDLPGMRPHNNTCLVCVLSAKSPSG